MADVQGLDELSHISGAHRSHREFRDAANRVFCAGRAYAVPFSTPCVPFGELGVCRATHGAPVALLTRYRCLRANPPQQQESGRQLGSSQAFVGGGGPGGSVNDSPRDGNTGVGIQFKTNTSSGILYVTSILKDGPSQNRGIMTGDIVAEVDGVDVLNRREGEKPWPFERVSPLIKGAPGSVVTIAFLRPSAPPQDEDDPGIPEGQTFQVKIRRQDRRGPASDFGMSPRGSQQAQPPPALPGGSSSGTGPAWHAAIESDRGDRPPTPPYGGRLADDDSDMGRADVSIEARLRAHARGAVNAAAMARKLMTSSGTLKSSIMASSRSSIGGDNGGSAKQHRSLPPSAGAALREDLGLGRRPYSESSAQGGVVAAGGGGGGGGGVGGGRAGGWIKKQPVSAAERVLMAQDLAAQQRELRLRLRALHVASDEARQKDQDANASMTWKVEVQPLHQEKRRASERPRGDGSGDPRGESGGVKDPSNDGVLSANELQEQDRARILKRLITSRTSRPHTTIKGYLFVCVCVCVCVCVPFDSGVWSRSTGSKKSFRV